MHRRKKGQKSFSTGEPYIYAYAPNGVLAGYQVRFKTQRNNKVQSVSQYFSLEEYGGKRRALAAAQRWRDANARWMIDPRFRPTFLIQRTGKPRGGVGRVLSRFAR